MINWVYFPKSDKPPSMATNVVGAFDAIGSAIDSETSDLSSNQVLATVRPKLEEIGFQVESGKKRHEKINVPVLFGMNGQLEKSFEADAYHIDSGFVIEVEAGRGVVNNQFLKNLFQACMMHDVHFLAIAVRNRYKRSNDFQQVNRFFETLYASNRLTLLLSGILIIGY